MAPLNRPTQLLPTLMWASGGIAKLPSYGLSMKNEPSFTLPGMYPKNNNATAIKIRDKTTEKPIERKAVLTSKIQKNDISDSERASSPISS